MSQQPDVLILGGGVIGLTTAYYLRRAGVGVAVVDRGELGQESSWAGAGIIPSAPPRGQARDPYDQLASLSAELHPQLAEQLRAETGVDNGYLKRGGWELYSPHEHVPILSWRGRGIPFEPADEAFLRAREPALALGPNYAFFLPQTAQVRNPRHVKALLAWCGQNGVALRPGCAVHGFEMSGQKVLAAR